MQVLNGAGNGTFTPGTKYTNVNAGNAAVADFNRDGHLYIMATNPRHGKGPGAALILGTSGGLGTAVQPINAGLVGNAG